ncbi:MULTISPECIES: YbfB/YjiJ family MFS transporter [unclassified Chelatococcus]|uniref:YbfB/YjiJ family MFS transporter n=2 Tax=Chelatococcus TaxID=28209 RepID=UPI0020C0749C|nr:MULTISPECIES: YbfB/YjiJ family MFS transporter [unclassified Chelatococcus]CAH1671989.1 putative MFS family arabinose efflux permease [Hyphomicrobiales bacterium]CAH1675792.1 putative MFS family arabinose efflux permease [Hyphomicrobiales bacterium]
MHQPSPAATSQMRLRDAIMIATASAASLAVAMGIGRFAFTAVLPMMLHDGVVDLGGGSYLATANYLGYLAGAILCTALPRTSSRLLTVIIRLSLIATALLTAGMAWPQVDLWGPFRFLSGVVSAVAFVLTSDWCVRELASRGKVHLASLMYTGPGLGITLSGLAAGGMVAAEWRASSAWLAFAALSTLIVICVWPAYRKSAAGAEVTTKPASISPPNHSDLKQPHARQAQEPDRGSPFEMAFFAISYGLAGFGYIVTATFLPVIARDALPGSAWIELFWPIFGTAVVIGCILGTRTPSWIDYRAGLIACYVVQAAGVALTLVWPSVTGFVVSSTLVGLPFTIISFLAVQEVRRLRPHHVARYVGFLTVTYGIGQIAGPPLVGLLVNRVGSASLGFAIALGVAASSLLLGALLYALMIRLWPRSTNRAVA